MKSQFDQGTHMIYPPRDQTNKDPKTHCYAHKFPGMQYIYRER